jgi:hypothetical protein
VTDSENLRSRIKRGTAIFVVGLGLGALLTSSFLKPPVQVEYRERVKVEEKIVEKWRDRIVEVKVKDTKTKVVTKIVEVEKPGGEKVKTTEVVETADTNEKSNTDTTHEGERVVEKLVYRDVFIEQKPVLQNWLVTGTIGLDPAPIYGGMVQRRIIGPFFLGLWGNTAPSAGLSITGEF